jgi:CubicO group peptidase (beta-lactamase class C family)
LAFQDFLVTISRLGGVNSHNGMNLLGSMRRYISLVSKIVRRHSLFFVIAICALIFVQMAQADPGAHWERGGEGWSQEKLAQAKAEAEKINATAFLVIEHGKIVADWGDIQRPVYLHSIRKSLLSSLYGVAVAEKKINISETLASLDIDDKPPPLTNEEKQARIGDLLKSRSGIYHKAADEAPNVEEIRPARGSHPHDTFWWYNNWDFNALGTIYQMKTGYGVFDAFYRDIGKPIQMEDFHTTDCNYHYVRESLYPAYRMSLSARDLARFGLLYLNKGKWNGKQVVPADWVRDSLHAWSSSTVGGVSYGYLWWLADGKIQFKNEVGPGSFSARGTGGELLLVAPALDLVVVQLYDTTKPGAGDITNNFGEVLRLVLAARSGAPKPNLVHPAASLHPNMFRPSLFACCSIRIGAPEDYISRLWPLQ